MGFWRDRAREVIAAALADGAARGLSGPALEVHVRAAYPFGPRLHHPYQIWCDEMARQFRGKRGPVRRRKRTAGDLDQGSLFDA